MSTVAVKPHSLSFTSSRTILRHHSPNVSLQNVAATDEEPMSGASSVESLVSNASLPSCINGSLAGNFDLHGYERLSLRTAASMDSGDVAAGRISHWAVSFERLLDDPLGVRYFKEFLRKEFSEENILFWEACEHLKRSSSKDEDHLRQEIHEIYEKFFSSNAAMPVNIDSQGRQLAEEALTAPPRPDAFGNQQQQVYTLMRLDSYSRFLKSDLYRQCMLAEMEGLPLPLDSPDPVDAPDPFPPHRRTSRSVDTGSLQRKSKKKSSIKKGGIFGFKNRPKSQRETTSSSGSWSRQSSRESSESEPGLALTRTASLPSNVLDCPDPARVCHVTLWDNTSTVLYARRPGCATVAETLETLCANRGVSLSALDVFLQDECIGGDGRRPLSLDLDVSILASQSIVLERRSLFRLDMLPVKRSVGVKARPSKSVAEVLKPVLHKYKLDLDDLTVTIKGSDSEVSLEEAVSVLDGSRICVQIKPDKKRDKLTKDRPIDRKPPKSSLPDKKDTEELIELMSSLQSSKLDDQRGLLSSTDLELPEFLKLKPTNQNSNNNNASVRSYDAIRRPTSLPSMPKHPDYTATSVHSQISPVTSRGRHEVGKRNARKCYVELNARPKNFSTFKPSPLVEKGSRDHGVSDFSDVDEFEDATIVDEDWTSEYDPDLTLHPLPTPPRDGGAVGDSPMADFSPPTPLNPKVYRKVVER